MNESRVAATVDVPAGTLWRTIAAGGDVHRWFPDIVASSEIDGEGVGATRRCRMTNGAPLTERILEIDHAIRRFAYRIDEHPLAATDVVATLQVTSLGPDVSRVEWGATFDADASEAARVTRTLTEIYTTGIANLAAFHDGTATTLS